MVMCQPKGKHCNGPFNNSHRTTVTHVSNGVDVLCKEKPHLPIWDNLQMIHKVMFVYKKDCIYHKGGHHMGSHVQSAAMS